MSTGVADFARALAAGCAGGRQAYREAVEWLRQGFEQEHDIDELLGPLLCLGDHRQLGLLATVLCSQREHPAGRVALLVGALARADTDAASRIAAALAAGGEVTARALVNHAASAGPQLRLRILATLYRMESLPEDIAPRLVPFLLDPAEGVADWVEWVLARIGPPASAALLECIPGSARAVRCMGLMGRPAGGAREALIARCRDAAADVRLALLEALPHLGCDEAVAASLLREEVHGNGHVHLQAALRVAGGVFRARREKATRHPRTGHAGAGLPAPPAACGGCDELVGFVKEALAHENEWVRARAAMVLEEAGPDARGAEPLLRAALSDPVPLVRLHSARALERTGVAESVTVEALVRGLEDEDPDAGYASALALGGAGRADPEVVARIAGLLRATAPATRARAALALGSLGSSAGHCCPSLLPACTESNPEVRRWAVWALAAVGATGEEVVAQLARALRDPAGDVRRQALLALGQVVPGRPRYCAEVAPLLHDPEEMVREAAARTLLVVSVSGAKEVQQVLRAVDVDKLAVLEATRKKLAALTGSAA